MVWSLSPIDSSTGEETYYIFSVGTYKVGRKGCDVIISNDKGVSRIHAEIVVDAMASPSLSVVQILDCSKFGTFIKTDLASSKENIKEFPHKKTTLNDGDLISFGTGNATYRFSFVPFFVCCSMTFQVPLPLQERISAFGATFTHTLSADCTHVLVDQSMRVNDDLVDAMIAKKPVVLVDWIEVFAGKNIQTEIPTYSQYLPNLAFNGLSVKIADPRCRENCVQGYTFVLDLACKYKLGNKFQPLLEVGGAKVIYSETFSSSTQGLECKESDWMVGVIPEGSLIDYNTKLKSLSRINEVNLICAVFSGHMDRAAIQSPSVVLLSSSCSTDETVVADSDVEIETNQRGGATSTHATHIKAESIVNMPTDDVATNSMTAQIAHFGDRNDATLSISKIEDPEDSGCEIIYSQNLIRRNVKLPTMAGSSLNDEVSNFKCFRKNMQSQCGNRLNSLVPFSRHPYKDSDLGSDVVESITEEKKRKQIEKAADDLFNNDKARRQTAAGTGLRGILSHY